MRDTIFALSSGLPPAGVAVIRISGPGVRFGLETVAGGVPQALHHAKAIGWFAPGEIRSLPTPGSIVSCMDMLASGEHRLRTE